MKKPEKPNISYPPAWDEDSILKNNIDGEPDEYRRTKKRDKRTIR